MAGLKVLVTDHVFPNLDPEREILGEIGAEVVYPGCDVSDERLVELAVDVDGVLNTYRKIPAALYDAAKKCRIITRYGIGIDTIDVAKATKCGIIVTNVPDYCIDEVSDHTLAHILGCARKITVSNQLVKSGKWSLAPVKPMYRLRSRTLGLYGFGRIPRLVAVKAKVFGVKVVACDPYVPEAAIAAAGVRKVSFEELCREADIISIHAPLTEETRGVFNAKAFSIMKDGVIIVNTARGPLVNEADLYAAVVSGKIGAAALDVTVPEPPAADNPILKLPNVILTPHSAWYSEEALVDLQRKAAAEVARVLKGEPPQYQVNNGK